MASEEGRDVSVDEKSSETNVYNPKLDFFSEQFDPLLALRTPGVKAPIANAKTYDNLIKFKNKQEGKTAALRSKKVSDDNVVKAPERRWLPHQLPVTVERRFRPTKNFVTYMDGVDGPLALLKTCKDDRLRIKVWTRHSHDIRGYCLAYVVAFDKHWNLALEDVEEVWTRPKKRKVPALTSFRNDQRIQPKVLPTPIIILQTTKKTETCSRHMKQIIVRGEHVAYIVVISKLVEQKANVNSLNKS